MTQKADHGELKRAAERLLEFASACDVAVRQFGPEHFKARDPAQDAKAIRAILAALEMAERRALRAERDAKEYHRELVSLRTRIGMTRLLAEDDPQVRAALQHQDTDNGEQGHE